jgi:hypothetical protein
MLTLDKNRSDSFPIFVPGSLLEEKTPISALTQKCGDCGGNFPVVSYGEHLLTCPGPADQLPLWRPRPGYLRQ